jgi:hypothetical protein
MARPTSGDTEAVDAFMTLVRGPLGDNALTDAGFTLP